MNRQRRNHCDSSVVIEALESRRLLNDVVRTTIGGPTLEDGTLSIVIETSLDNHVFVAVQNGVLSLRTSQFQAVVGGETSTFNAADVNSIVISGNPNVAHFVTLDASVNISALIWGSHLADSIVGGSGNHTI